MTPQRFLALLAEQLDPNGGPAPQLTEAVTRTEVVGPILTVGLNDGSAFDLCVSPKGS